MDSVLLAGSISENVEQSMQQLGYYLVREEDLTSVTDMLQSTVVDALFVMTDDNEKLGACLDSFRSDAKGSKIPCVVLASDEAAESSLAEREDALLTVLSSTTEVESQISEVAKVIRASKYSGEAVITTLGEMNEELRELTARYSKELDEAFSMQQSLMPPALAENDKYEIASLFKPLKEVGGGLV